MIGAIVSSIPTFLPTIATYMPVIGKMATNIMRALATLDVNKVLKIADVVINVSEMFNLVSSGTSVEELGLKAMNGEKSRSDFESSGAYVKYLEKEVSVASEMNASMSKEDKIVATAVGTAVLMTGIDEVHGVVIGLDFYKAVTEKALPLKEIKAIIEAFKVSDVSLEDFSKFTEGTLEAKTSHTVSQLLRTVFTKMDDLLSNDDISERIIDLKN